MKELHENTFTGGLNTDDEDRLIPSNDYRYALNIRNTSTETGEIGVIRNTKGNKEVVVTLPGGNNKVVGSYWDKENNTNFYFIYNEFGRHQIKRFYPNENRVETVIEESTLPDPVLNFQKDTLITEINIVGDFLYWTDYANPPRKINVKTATKEGKKYVFRAMFDYREKEFYKTNNTWYLSLSNDSGGNYQYEITTTPQDSHKELMNSFVTLLLGAADVSGGPAFNTFADVESCGNYIEVSMKDTQKWNLQFGSLNNGDALMFRYNQYYDDYDIEATTVLKTPLQCEPKVKLISNGEKKYNYIKNKVFQFRTGLVFRDGEETRLSPVSVYAYNPFACGSSSAEDVLNGIEVDYTDDRLNDENFLSLLKHVDLFVKEGDLGEWKLVKSIPVEEIGLGEQKYDFFNDGSYTVISSTKSDTLFDAVPKLAGTQEFMKDKMFYADCVEGFDNVCVDANLTVNYEDSPNSEELYNITFRVRIANVFQGSAQPIWDFGDGPAWGGLANSVTSPQRYVTGVRGEYNQSIDLKGFVGYLAGTNKYAITTQNVADINIGSTTVVEPKLTDSTYKVYDGTSVAERKKLVQLITAVGGEIYSEGVIENVPKGNYVLRIASHLTTQGQLDDGTRQYQKTSTNVIATNAGPGAIGNESSEIHIEVVDQDVDAGTFYIADLTQPKNGEASTSITGYVVDKDEEVSSPPTVEELFGDKRIELSYVDIDQSEGSFLPLLSVFPVSGIFGPISNSNTYTSIKAGGGFYTDHNGYFFSSRSYPVGASIADGTEIKEARSGAEDLMEVQYEVDPTGNVITFTKATQTRNYQLYLRNSNDDVQTYSRTKIKGSVVDSSGVGVPDVVIVNTRGDAQRTDIDGNFEIITYADTSEIPQRRRRADELFFSALESTCLIDFDRTSESYDIQISSVVGDYNNLDEDDDNSNTYSIDDVIVSLIGGGVINTEKRGSDKQFGIVYYGYGNQSGAVNTDEEDLRVHINFFTEPDKDTGTILGRGKATISWEINHNPPEWATHYQWLRTKDASTTKYVDWIAKEVEYVDDALSPSNQNDATLIKIDISNMFAEYVDKNPNSLVTITPDKNWKVRFIADSSGTPYDEYLEYDILNFLDETTIIIKNNVTLGRIDEGVVFEIYDPSPNFDNRLYYEFGECYEIGNPGTSSAYHKGPTQDQTSTRPAKGTFKTGDAWLRDRIIPIEGGETQYTIQDASISDFYESKVDHTGRINSENPNAKELVRPTLWRWSEPILRESDINGLSTFDPFSSRKFDEGYGRIYKLQGVENVLLGIHKNRWVAGYIDEGLLTTLTGTDSVTKDDAVVGGTRALKGIFGTENRESVVEYQGTVYCWDVNRGMVLQYASNGLFPISSYKMNNHFLNLSKNILDNNTVSSPVLGAYDTLNKEYVMHFNYTQETISFSDKSKRWVSFWSYRPEMMGNTGLKFISFNEGKLYVHDENEIRNNYYGKPYSIYIRPVSNGNPSKVKVYSAIHQESNEAWEAEQILIPKSNVAPNGMESYIPLNRVRPIEGVQYSEILRDINTPGFTDQDEALLNGRHLRGHICDILLKNSLTTEVEMFAMNVIIVQSEYSKKV